MRNLCILGCIAFGYSVLLGGCVKDVGESDATPAPAVSETRSAAGVPTKYPRLPEFADLGLNPDASGETVMDFSRVGYKWGDEPIPELPVVKTISSPGAGRDATKLINDAIVEVAGKPLAQRGAILLKAGQYEVSGVIRLYASGIVLRGEGRDEKTGTRIVATRTDNGPAMIDDADNPSILILLQGTGGRSGKRPAEPNILGPQVPAGRFWLRVSNASSFSVGDNVVVERHITPEWISALRMDRISALPGYDPASYQWTPSLIAHKQMERVVTKVSGDTLWFENPVSLRIERAYGGGSVYKYSYTKRISGSGIENMFLNTSSSKEFNENHCWSAVTVNRARHCWVRGVDSKRFGFTGVDIRQYACNITVEDCKVRRMHAVMDGNRRYPFLIRGQLSLVKDCYAETGRHSFATSGPVTNGPNVFLDCEARMCYADAGPHARLATATLYDNVTTYKVTAAEAIPGVNIDGNYVGAFLIIDRDRMGPGHGWAEINGVMWNCETTGNICVQKPWVSGNNYMAGCKGVAWAGYMPDREAGKTVSFGTFVSPRSVYEAQLALRRQHQPGGVMDVR